MVDILDGLGYLCRKIRNQLKEEVVEGFAIRVPDLGQTGGIVIPKVVEGTDSVECSVVTG